MLYRNGLFRFGFTVEIRACKRYSCDNKRNHYFIINTSDGEREKVRKLQNEN